MARMDSKYKQPGACSKAQGTLGKGNPCTPAINDNDEAPDVTITFSDLSQAMQLDEDTLLQRLATIIQKRPGISRDDDDEGEED